MDRQRVFDHCRYSCVIVSGHRLLQPDDKLSDLGRVRDASHGIRIIGAGGIECDRKKGNQEGENNVTERPLKCGDAHYCKFLLTTWPGIEDPMNTANTRPEPDEPSRTTSGIQRNELTRNRGE
jgi:hypothetical protein